MLLVVAATADGIAADIVGISGEFGAVTLITAAGAAVVTDAVLVFVHVVFAKMAADIVVIFIDTDFAYTVTNAILVFIGKYSAVVCAEIGLMLSKGSVMLCCGKNRE